MGPAAFRRPAPLFMPDSGAMRCSRTAAVLVLVVAAGCPCTRSAELPAKTSLLSQLRSGLAERERKLESYRLEGATTDVASGQQARFRFAFRAPGQMRGELLAPTPHVFAFDGHQLAEVAADTGTLTQWDLTGLDRHRADAVLHEIFAPFAPEGFRAPLIPAGPQVQVTAIDGGDPSVLRVSADLADGAEAYHFEYDFRAPAMDLLRELTRAPSGERIIEVVKERCDAAWGFCLPAAWVEKVGGQEISRTVLSTIEANPALAPSDFVLAVPDGGHAETRRMLAADDAGGR